MLICDAYLMPASIDEAFDAMAQHAARYRIVAGATDTLPWAREGRAGDLEIPVVIDICKIPELKERRVEASRVRLGAAVPMQRFLDDAEMARALPAMPQCAVWFADDQIRESATIGGNIVNASPAADGTPPLIAHEARVERLDPALDFGQQPRRGHQRLMQRRWNAPIRRIGQDRQQLTDMLRSGANHDAELRHQPAQLVH